MTTLVGIEAGKGKKGVILGSDLSATSTNWIPDGDVAYRKQTKSENQKIYVNNDRTAAICMAGILDDLYSTFLYDFLDNKFDLEKITHQEFFSDVLKLNLDRWEGKVPKEQYINGFLLATRFGDPKLWTCWPLGKVERKNYNSVGSGSDYALRYLSEYAGKIPDRISIDEGMDLTINSLDKASQDIYTGGLDLVVLTKDNIFDFGNTIRKKMDNAKLKAIEACKKQIE